MKRVRTSADRPSSARRLRNCLPSLALILILIPQAAGAIGLEGDWTWEALRSIAGADETQVDWIVNEVPLEEARRIVELVNRLSSPEAGPLMSAYPYLDGTYRVLTDQELERLRKRPPPGDAGVVHLLYTVARTRADVEERREERSPGVFRSRFEGGAIVVEPRTLSPTGVELTFDFAPARSLLSLLRAGEQNLDRIRAALESPEFAALLEHRSQSFYSRALTWEMLTVNIALAGSRDPLPQLYGLANPVAFYDLGDVRAHLDRYQALIDTLEERQQALASRVLAPLAPGIPEGVSIERRISFFFGAGADGWTAGEVAGIDLEYFKDDVDALVRLLSHETYHVVQEALAPESSGESEESAGPSALRVLFDEGTATWLAPPMALSEEERRARIERGRQLLETVASGSDEQAEAALQEGTRGAGPFYWLGAAMAETLAEAEGPSAVGATLAGGYRAFVQAYSEAAAHIETAPVAPDQLARLQERR